MAHTISGQWLLNSLMSCSSRGSDRQDSKTAIFSSFLLLGRKWLNDARRYVWDLSYHIFHCYTIVTLHCPPKLPYAVTHPSDFAHLFPESTTYSQLSNNTVSLLVLQALLRMEDVSRLSRFGTQVNDPRVFLGGTGTAQYLSEKCLVRSLKQFLACQVQRGFGQQESRIP